MSKEDSNIKNYINLNSKQVLKSPEICFILNFIIELEI